MRERSRNPIFWWLVKKTKTPLHMGILRGQEPAPPPTASHRGKGPASPGLGHGSLVPALPSFPDRLRVFPQAVQKG